MAVLDLEWGRAHRKRTDRQKDGQTANTRWSPALLLIADPVHARASTLSKKVPEQARWCIEDPISRSECGWASYVLLGVRYTISSTSSPFLDALVPHSVSRH
jgi:hypothetical protein